MTRDRTHIPALVLLAAVLVGATLWFTREKPTLGPLLSAYGGKWEARDLEWTEYNGYWRVSTTARLLRHRGSSLRFSKALTGLCGAVLTKLPNAPEGVTRQDLYRLDLNLEYVPKKGAAIETAFEEPVPIQVRYGTCNMRDESEAYFKTYPGDLASWELSDIIASADDNSQPKLELIFRRLNNNVELEFQPIQICEAFFADPHSYIYTMQADQDLPENLNGISVRVTDNKQYGNSLLNFKTGKFYDLQHVNGVCQAAAESEQT